MTSKFVPVQKLLDLIAAESVDCPQPPPNPNSPFRLLWPTEFHTVTQWYAANKALYAQYGLPGHEGLDLRATDGSMIFAGAPGKVVRVELNPASGAYGIHVRVEHDHPDGPFESIYAHLKSARVSLNDQVVTGQLLGLADSTGNSSAAHLHLTLKRRGVGSRSYFPNDIVNPVPYLPELFPGSGWQVVVAGNLRQQPSDTAAVISFVTAGPLVTASGAFVDDWWEIILSDGTRGWFWNPGYKLAVV